MNSSENKVASSPLSVTAGFGSYVCDRWGGEDSPACNEDGSPAIVEGNEVIVRDYWEDERGPHFSTDRHPVDGERFYWSAPNTEAR